jgi:hypothetical protein
LRNYFTVFDMEYGIVGLSPHSSSPATLNIFDRQVPDATLEASTDALTLDSLAFLSNTVFAICLIVCCCIIYSYITGESIHIEVTTTVENMQKLLNDQRKGSDEKGTELIVIR